MKKFFFLSVVCAFLALQGYATAQVTSIPCNQLPAITGDVTRPAGSCAATYNGIVPVAKGGTGVTTAAGEQARLGPSQMTFRASAVNFNSANTDNAIAIALPTGYTRYSVRQFIISHPSAVITTATFGVFTATGGAGTALVTSATVTTMSSTAEDTNNNMQINNVNNLNSQSFSTGTTPTLYFRVQTAQGSAATADVGINIWVLP